MMNGNKLHLTKVKVLAVTTCRWLEQKTDPKYQKRPIWFPRVRWLFLRESR